MRISSMVNFGCKLQTTSPTLAFAGRAEDLANARRRLWSVSEAGARKFAIEDPPETYNPYIFYTTPVSENRTHGYWMWDTYTTPRRDYWGWYDDADRIRMMDANGDGREDIPIGPKRHTGEWIPLQSFDADDNVCTHVSDTNGCFLPRTWAVDTLQGWWNDSDRVRVMDINADGFDHVVVGPQSTGVWHVLQTK